jgi:hypothetical protein
MHQMSYADVATQTQLTEPLLRHLARYGVISSNAVLDTCDADEAKQIAARLHQARAAVAGNLITANSAAVKYGFDTATVWRWRVEGRITAIDDLVDEGDIAFAKALADTIGQKQGRSIWPPRPRSGRPRKTP